MVAGDAGVEAGVARLTVPDPEAPVLLVVHVEQVVVVVPVQRGLGVPAHAHLQADVAARAHCRVPHLAQKGGRRRRGLPRLRSALGGQGGPPPRNEGLRRRRRPFSGWFGPLPSSWWRWSDSMTLTEVLDGGLALLVEWSGNGVISQEKGLERQY